MSAEANPTSSGDLTSFDVAHGAGEGAPTCTSCAKQITTQYHEANGAIVCSTCRAKIESELRGGSSAGRFARAVGLGAGGAAVGALLYFAVLKLTGYEVGLIAIAVGWLVGRGVHRGSGGRGGWRYQTLAVALTYSAIVVTYIPFIVQELRNQPELTAMAADSIATGAAETAPDGAGGGEDAAATGGEPSAPAPAEVHPALAAVIGLGLLFAMAALMPVLAGVENIIGLLIIGFALFQAWSMNRRVTVTFTGPYKVGAPRPSEQPGAA